MKKLPTFNFFIQEINNIDYIQKFLQENFFMINMSYLILKETEYFLVTFFVINYIHCDRKSHIFRLVIKYLRTFKIFIEEIRKYSKFSLFLHKINVYI